ncbi:MAG: Bax inhibitor-1/YccA family protein [Bacteroidetes bacterium]|nr:MAG: Bax inhibitor-1/YccA family protein [Bacteroidota bacterium]
MSNFFQNSTGYQERQFVESGAANAFMQQVFTTMSLGLLITGMAAWYVSQTPALINFFLTGFMMYVVMFAPLIFVIVLASRINKMSFTAASLTFATYSLINGISFSFIFLVYDLGAIFKVFLITAGTFGAMALAGATTKLDLSKMGSILFMALIGIIIASVVNWFLGSPMLDYLISIAGVVIFSGLTAYDTQKLIRIGAQVDAESETSRKIALMGALTLYLDFINLFLFLLRIFGGSRD